MRSSLSFLLGFAMVALVTTTSAQVPVRVFNVRDYGAKGDGVLFDRVKLPATAGAARVVLKNVNGLTIDRSPGLADLKREEPIANEQL
jgi:hypothetical protein